MRALVIVLGLAVVVGLVAFIASTYGVAGKPPLTAPSIEGAVTHVDLPGTGYGAIRIEERPDQDSGGNKAVVRITERTKLYRDIGGVYEEIAFREVKAGPLVRARAWFIGPVAESYPVQAEAAAVVVWTLAP